MAAFLLILFCELFMVAFSRLNLTSEACKVYLNKFGTVEEGGAGPTILAYTGNATFIQETSEIKVNLLYSDPLYNNASYFGLVQEDGKTADETCLDLKLWKFPSDTISNPVQVTDLPIAANNNLNNKWKCLSFNINQTDFETRLVQTYNSAQYIYTGYYSITYSAAETTEEYYTFYFSFLVAVSRTTGQIMSTDFLPTNQFDTHICPIGCCMGRSNIVKWCTDATCETNTMPVINFKDQFYLRQIVTYQGLFDYYLTNTTVYYLSDDLYKQIKPISINNSVPGQITLLLTADIVWTNISIQVISYISTTQNGETRFLEETTTTYDPLIATTQILTCIKYDETYSTCATCAQQCEVNNGIATSQCPICFSSLLILQLYILSLFII